MADYKVMERYRGTRYPPDGHDDRRYDGLYVFCDEWGADASGEPFYETKKGCPGEVWANLLGLLQPGDTVTMLKPNSVKLRLT